MLEQERNVAFYTHEEVVTDMATGEILSATKKTVAKTSAEPDFIKVYYETMMAFHQIHDIPVTFLLSLSKILEWSNDGKPLKVILNKCNKDMIAEECNVTLSQVDRYIKKSVNNGLLFRTKYRGVYEVNPFMIAKGKWDSIKQLRTQFDFIGGKWVRNIDMDEPEHCDEPQEQVETINTNTNKRTIA